MCEIFPEVKKCFYILPNRTGLIFIAILALVNRNASVDFESLKTGFKNITVTGNIGPQVHTLVRGFITIICVMFMVLGIILLVANLLDAQEVVIVFVWGTMLNVVLGFITVGLVFYECFISDIEMCILNGIDWFTVGFIYTGVLVKLVLWMYFAAVANTYMEDGS